MSSNQYTEEEDQREPDLKNQQSANLHQTDVSKSDFYTNGELTKSHTQLKNMILVSPGKSIKPVIPQTSDRDQVRESKGEDASYTPHTKSHSQMQMNEDGTV